MFKDLALVQPKNDLQTPYLCSIAVVQASAIIKQKKSQKATFFDGDPYGN